MKRMTDLERLLAEREANDRLTKRLEEERQKHRAFADQVIDLLGLRAEYQDHFSYYVYGRPATEKEYNVAMMTVQPGMSSFHQAHMSQSRGSDRFIADVGKASDALAGRDALKRIRAAAKETLK